MSKLNSTCRWKLFEEFFSGNLLFLNFFAIWLESFQSFFEFFGGVVESCILPVTRNIWVFFSGNVSFVSIVVFDGWARSFRDLRRSFFGRSSKTNFMCHQERFRSFLYEKSQDLWTLSHVAENVSGLRKGNFAMVPIIAFYFSIGKSWGTFADENKILPSIVFGHWNKIFWPFVEIISIGLWKIPSMCPYYPFEPKFSLRKSFFLKIFGHRVKHFRLFAKNVSIWSLKLQSTCPRECLEQK